MIYLLVGQPRHGKSQFASKLAHDIHEQNLKTQNKPVCTRNVFTGEEKTYYSVAECGRDLCISDRTINYKLEKSRISLFVQ